MRTLPGPDELCSTPAERSKWVVVSIAHFCRADHYHWRIQGRGPGAPAPPLFLDQTEAGRKKNLLETAASLSKGLDDWVLPPSPLSQGLDPALTSELRKSNLFYWFYIGYAHRSIDWKYVFLLHVVDKNENIISDLSGPFWNSQKFIISKKKKTI